MYSYNSDATIAVRNNAWQAPHTHTQAHTQRDRSRTFAHGLGPVLVDLDELLGLNRHLLGDVPPHEDGL